MLGVMKDSGDTAQEGSVYTPSQAVDVIQHSVRLPRGKPSETVAKSRQKHSLSTAAKSRPLYRSNINCKVFVNADTAAEPQSLTFEAEETS